MSPLNTAPASAGGGGTERCAFVSSASSTRRRRLSRFSRAAPLAGARGRSDAGGKWGAAAGGGFEAETEPCLPRRRARARSAVSLLMRSRISARSLAMLDLGEAERCLLALKEERIPRGPLASNIVHEAGHSRPRKIHAAFVGAKLQILQFLHTHAHIFARSEHAAESRAPTSEAERRAELVDREACGVCESRHVREQENRPPPSLRLAAHYGERARTLTGECEEDHER